MTEPHDHSEVTSLTEGLDPATARVVEVLAAADVVAALSPHRRKRVPVDRYVVAVLILACAILILALYAWQLSGQVQRSRTTRDSQFGAVIAQLHSLESQLQQNQRHERRQASTNAELVREIGILSEYIREHDKIDPGQLVQPTAEPSPQSSPTSSSAFSSSPSPKPSSHPSSPTSSPMPSPSPTHCTVRDPLTGRCILLTIVRPDTILLTH